VNAHRVKNRGLEADPHWRGGDATNRSVRLEKDDLLYTEDNGGVEKREQNSIRKSGGGRDTG